MIQELRPIGLYDAARTLGIDPFEVVRLLVVADAVPSGQLRLTDDHVDKIRETGGIEFWWTEPLPESDNPRRALVQAMIARLIDQGYVGDRGTRIDNLWRGLPVEEIALLQQAVNVLAHGGHLVTFLTPRGVQAALTADSVEHLRGVAEGQTEDESLAVLWG